jgi:hypothetical protein
LPHFNSRETTASGNLGVNLEESVRRTTGGCSKRGFNEVVLSNDCLLDMTVGGCGVAKYLESAIDSLVGPMLFMISLPHNRHYYQGWND